MVHVVPFESNLQALRHAIVSQALNPTVVNGMMFDWERIVDLLAAPELFAALGLHGRCRHSGQVALLMESTNDNKDPWKHWCRRC